jgi:glycosyltransferase involved in cell wall biosynthesis
LSERLRILLVIQEFPPQSLGGSEIHTADLAKALAPRHDVSVFTTAMASAGADSVRSERRDGFTLIAVARGSRPPDLRHAYENADLEQAFQHTLDSVRPDVVHFHGIWGVSNLLPLLARRAGARTVFTLHDFWLMCPRGQRLQQPHGSICWDVDLARCETCLAPWIDPPRLPSAGAVVASLRSGRLFNASAWQRAAARVLRRSAPQPDGEVQRYHSVSRQVIEAIDLFIAPSQFLRAEFVRYGIDPSRIVHSDNGIDTTGLHRPKRPSALFRFGFIGSLIPSKGAHVLIDAFEAAGLPATELLIFGAAPAHDTSGYADGLRRQALNAGVRFMGRFDRSRTAEVFEQIDVLVMPSLWFENSPLVIKEAFASGTPVIASRLGGMVEQVVSGTSGILFDAGSRSDLSDALRLMRSGTFCELLRRGLPRVKTIAEHARELEQVYAQGPVAAQVG